MYTNVTVVSATGRTEKVLEFVPDLRDVLVQKPMLVKDYEAIIKAAEELAVALGRPVEAHYKAIQKTEYLVCVDEGTSHQRMAKVWESEVVDLVPLA